MTDLEKLALCAGASLLVHFALERGLEQLPPRAPLSYDHKIAIQVVQPPKEEPPPEPPKEEPKPPPKEIHEAPRPQPAKEAPKPKDVPPPDKPPTTTDTTDTPVFGVTMESTSTGGNGPAMPIGNTTKQTPQNVGSAAPTAAPKQLAEPVAAFEATKMPLPQGRCVGKYTDDARSAGIEGTVVLDLIVGEDGHVREVKVVQGLDHGLSEAAIAALRGCTFTPGEKNGHPVPVRVRGFKIHFVLAEAD
jgi:protein TonB